jgi:two-component system, OmpR family, sensor kinase
MFKSIRWTLQLWHAGILLLALGSFGTILYLAAQRSAYIEIDNELAGAARVFAAPGIQIGDILPDCLRRLGWNDADQPYFIIWAADGAILRQSSPCPSVPHPVGLISSAFRQRGDLREVVAAGPAGRTILVGRSIHRELAGLANLRWSLLGAGAAVLAIGMLGSIGLARRALRPIQLISDAARSISGSDLSRRIDLRETKSELGSLAETLNDAFDRLESAFHRQAQFTADASHELRTPLSVIRAGGELALKKSRTSDEYRKTIESSLRAARRMQSLVESLLVLARADAHALELNYTRFDLRAAVDECAALLLPVAIQRNVRIKADGAGIELEADRDRILQLLTNLIGNAIQYNREGGSATVLIVRDGSHVAVKVVDTGIGIATRDQARIFERFFRADPARDRDSGGCGLGLAICRSIACAHGGDISFSSVPGVGSAFMVRLPACKSGSEINPLEPGNLAKRSA